MPATIKNADNKLKEDINHLLSLQDINQNLDGLVEEIDKLKEEAAFEEKKFMTKQNQYDKHFPILQRAQKEYDEIKVDLEEIKQKIEELEEKKKKIKTIKEFKAINKEIDTLNKKNAIKENDLLTKSEELEFKKTKVEDIQQKIEEIKEVIENKKNDLEVLIKERKDSINKYTKEKEKLEGKLSKPLVATFNRIYKHKFRVAIVPIEDQICHGCYMRTPMQVEINVKKNEEIIFCPSCSRILFTRKKSTKLSA